ncbi:MAG: hypothetical protein IPJ39_15430 [Saprospiraceae bacterium]|nr:hypothetical protein [Saprospiraceae bacterium]
MEAKKKMKLKYKYEDRKVKAKLTKESYEVIGFGEIDGKLQPILIVNDELEIYSMANEAVEVIDNTKIGYEKVSELAYGADFFLKKELIKYCKQFKSYTDLQINHIWNKSKLINYFLNSEYEIPSGIEATVLNPNYKSTLIEGYILAVNNYLTIRNKYGFWEMLFFKVLDSLTGHIQDEFRKGIEIEELDVKNYKDEIVNHLKQTIYVNQIGEKESEGMVTELFKLIDSIFINEIESINKVKSFHEEEIIIKYESKYYSISKLCGS